MKNIYNSIRESKRLLLTFIALFTLSITTFAQNENQTKKDEGNVSAASHEQTAATSESDPSTDKNTDKPKVKEDKEEAAVAKAKAKGLQDNIRLSNKWNEIENAYGQIKTIQKGLDEDAVNLEKYNTELDLLIKANGEKQKRNDKMEKFPFDSVYCTKAIVLFCKTQLRVKYNDKSVDDALKAFSQLDKNEQMNHDNLCQAIKLYKDCFDDMKNVLSEMQIMSDEWNKFPAEDRDAEIYDNLQEEILNTLYYKKSKAGINIPYLQEQIDRTIKLLELYKKNKVLKGFKTVLQYFN